VFPGRTRCYTERVSAHRARCAFVTCEQVPALDPDDRVALEELRGRGVATSVSVWSDPSVDWSATALCLLRSTWDYHARYREFMAWVDRVTAVTVVRNDPTLVRWSAHKSYLRDLADRGVPVVPTTWLKQGDSHDIGAVTAAAGWRDVVIKPARGAAANDVLRVGGRGSGRDAGQAHLDRLLATHDVLVQPYLESVAEHGERALVFFDGRFSHAVRKKPFDTKLAIDAGSPRVDAADEEVAVARAAIDAAPGRPLYARVDLLRDDDGHACVNEVELIEPALYLSAHDPARVAFADAVERELEAIAS
jgi:glutathione synthase/RimK-type ligase-like ATP-grasp enzyme